MFVLPNRLTPEDLAGITSTEPGLYDPVRIRSDGRRIVSMGELSKFGRAFLDLIEKSLVEAGVDISDYIADGGMYYRVIDLASANADDRGGVFHYDTRRADDDLRNQSGPIRVVSALTSDGTDISNIFAEEPSHRGQLSGDVINSGAEDLVWTGNGSVVMFDEELDLHARPPAIPHAAGTTAVFASAILRLPSHDTIACEAFEPLLAQGR